MPRVVVRETASELPGPASALGGLFEGDLAIALDTGRGYYWDGSTWQGQVSVGGTVITGLITVTGNHVVGPSDRVILVDATLGDITISLPSATTVRALDVKKIDSSAHFVTLDADGADVIEGEPTLDLLYEGESVPIVSNGVSSWEIL